MSNLFKRMKIDIALLSSGLFLIMTSECMAQESDDKTWSMGFGAPDYMEVWIETADVVDIRERVFRGGIAKVWLGGPCLKSVEIARVVGKIDKRGPSQGKNEGRYALPLSLESKAYIEKFGIPYGSW